MTQYLTWGYSQGVPNGASAAWGCRAIVTQTGDVDVVPDRVSMIGTDDEKTRLLAHLNQVGMAAWKNIASGMLQRYEMRSREASEHVLFDDGTVRIVGNTNASYGYLYVAAFFTKEVGA